MNQPRKGSLLVIFLTVFIDLLGFGMVLPLLPIYAKQFAVQFGMPPDSGLVGLMIGLLMSSFSAMQFLFAPLWGRLSDRIGRRPVLMIGLGGSMVFYAIFAGAAYSTSLFWLFVSRIGAGVAGATISTAQAYIADTTTLERRAKGMALIGAAFGLGFTFGPLIGAVSFVASDQPELSIWPGVIASALSGLALLSAVFLLPESLTPRSEPARRKIFDLGSLRAALAVPSVGLLLGCSFISIVSFANFESTIALLLSAKPGVGGFDLTPPRVLLVFAFIGFVLSFAQGFLVRRMADRVPEGALAVGGAVTSIVGFVMLALASQRGSLPLLLAALSVEVVGFAFVTPALNSLISRRSDPAKQGGVLGVGQSISSLARIVGPIFGNLLFPLGTALPYWAAAGLMFGGLGLIVVASRRGKDFQE